MKFKHEIAIIEISLKHYRNPFYELLRKQLSKSNVELVLIHGFSSNCEAKKSDEVEIEWAHVIKNKCIRIGSRELYWQPCIKILRRADLIVVDQSSKLLLNYLLFIGHRLGIKKLCFWGHGKNFQEHSASRMGESAKRFLSRHVHWWFAYNDLSAEIIRSLGYPESRITSVQNAIDTKYLIGVSEKISKQHLKQIRNEFGIKGENVCIFIGEMYPEKHVSFLLEACLQIKKNISDFEMIFIGDGQDDYKVKKMAKKCEWIHYLGPKFDEGKIPFFVLSKLILIPGSVGLAILDGIALETPLITTDIVKHGPEIAYLVEGFNGSIIKVSKSAEVYASRVSNLLKNNEDRDRMIAGCRAVREKYTIEKMVEKFTGGVIKALHS